MILRIALVLVGTLVWLALLYLSSLTIVLP